LEDLRHKKAAITLRVIEGLLSRNVALSN